MESVEAFIEASTRRSALVARLRGMLEASVPVPPESPATPKSELNFAKGFPEPAKDENPELLDLLYKELWNPEPEGDGTETNGAQIFVSQVDPADPSVDPLDLPRTAPEFLYSHWKHFLDHAKKDNDEKHSHVFYLRNFRNGYNNANNYDNGGRENLPHLDKAMAWFNEGVFREFGFVYDISRYCPDASAVCLGRGGAYWCYERALAELEDYGEESGGASARYAAQKREVRANIEARMAPIPQRNAELWSVNVQAARDQSAAAAAREAADDLAEAIDAWVEAQRKWHRAAVTRNGYSGEKEVGKSDADYYSNEPDYSGPEGEECEKGIAEADAKEKAAREKAK
jgi:hypothetical protein